VLGIRREQSLVAPREHRLGVPVVHAGWRQERDAARVMLVVVSVEELTGPPQRLIERRKPPAGGARSPAIPPAPHTAAPAVPAWTWATTSRPAPILVGTIQGSPQQRGNFFLA
jgi:hypothetical protein